MHIQTPAMAGTMESSDIMIRIEPGEAGIELSLQSSVMQQFGRQIEAVIRHTLEELQVENARVDVVDRGALDCTIRARVLAAAYRAAGQEDYCWEVKP